MNGSAPSFGAGGPDEDGGATLPRLATELLKPTRDALEKFAPDPLHQRLEQVRDALHRQMSDAPSAGVEGSPEPKA